MISPSDWRTRAVALRRLVLRHGPLLMSLTLPQGTATLAAAMTAYETLNADGDGGHRAEALKHARALQALIPNNPSVDQLVRELGAP